MLNKSPFKSPLITLMFIFYVGQDSDPQFFLLTKQFYKYNFYFSVPGCTRHDLHWFRIPHDISEKVSS
jgi:hypothetical protein